MLAKAPTGAFNLQRKSIHEYILRDAEFVHRVACAIELTAKNWQI